MVTIRASVTTYFLSCVNNSSLVVYLSSGVLRIPFEVFSVLCGDTFTGTWANSVIARSLVECVSLSPEHSLLMVLGSPTKPWIPFWMANAESLERFLIISRCHHQKSRKKYFCFENFLPGFLISFKVCLVTIISSSSLFFRLVDLLCQLSMVCCVVFSSPWLSTHHGALQGGNLPAVTSRKYCQSYQGDILIAKEQQLQ